MDFGKVFEANAFSVSRVMSEPGRGLYVPAYQRPYAWKKDDTVALVTSICEGVQWLANDQDAITVIGSFIFVDDRERKTVEPAVRSDLPSAVFLVIDGQQRLCTMVLIAIALHARIGRAFARVKGEAAKLWGERHAAELTSRLERMLFFDREFGEAPYRYFPRIIRAFDDSWSVKEGLARYSSPVASILWSYLRFAKDKERKASAKFKWDAPEQESHQSFLKTFNAIDSYLGKLFEAPDPEREGRLPDLDAVGGSRDLQVRFFADEVPAEVLQAWKDETAESVQEFSRLVMFARYLLDNVAVTQIKVSKESYAFDLFETLNATGQPLTAYETFKPMVIRQEGLEHFKLTPSAQSLGRVDRYLEGMTDRRPEASNDLLRPFALFEHGDKLGKHLREQRNWLRTKYQDVVGDGRQEAQKAAGREYLRGMATVADFLRTCWRPDGPQFGTDGGPPNTSEAEAISFCLAVLHDSGHEITIALLSRFFGQILESLQASRQQAVREWAEVLQAVTAFFALWRGSRKGTDNIDAVHRSLMKESTWAGPFCRAKGTMPTAEAVRAGLRSALLADKLQDVAPREWWVEKAAGLDVYKQSRPLARLILLAAAHDAVPSPDASGLTQRGKSDVCPTLTSACWREPWDVEHIAPESRGEQDWPTEIYTAELVHSLGNLTLLPQGPNRSAGNADWRLKRLYYAALASETDAEAVALVEQAKAKGMIISDARSATLQSSPYTNHLRALSRMEVESVWSAEWVRERGRHLASMAWDTLAPWLGLGGTVGDEAFGRV